MTQIQGSIYQVTDIYGEQVCFDMRDVRRIIRLKDGGAQILLNEASICAVDDPFDEVCELWASLRCEL